jgi:HAE1 family hydrophobic/amphiphilic exporter-1
MTACATIFALIPMGLGLTGGGAFISRPLAVVVIGGLVSSTVLTLLLVPVLYSLVERRGERRRLAAQRSDQGGDQSGTGRPVGDQPGDDQPDAGQPAGGQAGSERPGAEEDTHQQPAYRETQPGGYPPEAFRPGATPPAGG